jgi:hypothetical protein
MGVPYRQKWTVAGMALLMSHGFIGTTVAAETTFTAYCGKCHARAASIARGVKGNTKHDRRETLDEFLSGHHAEDPAVRAEIVDYLIGLLSQ